MSREDWAVILSCLFLVIISLVGWGLLFYFLINAVTL